MANSTEQTATAQRYNHRLIRLSDQKLPAIRSGANAKTAKPISERELRRRECQSPQSLLALTVDHFCDAIGICRSNFYYQVKAGRIRTVLVGGRRLVPAAEVDRLLSRQEDEG